MASRRSFLAAAVALGEVPALLQSLGCRPPRIRKYNFEPAASFLFDARPMSTPCDRISPTLPRVEIVGPPIAPAVCHRAEELSLSTTEMPALAIDAGNQTDVSIIGSEADLYKVRFCAQAGGSDQNDARVSLDKIALNHTGRLLEVRTPQYSRERPVNAWLRIEASRRRAVTVKGTYSYMEVFGIDAPVHISTTHARIKLLDVSGEVEAASSVGIIDFAGDRGQIQLQADGEIGEINLKPTAARFRGTLDASAEVAIRVLLPPGFESPFEAIVDRPELFVCRAALAPQVRRHSRGGAVVFSYGSGDPVLRLRSHGALVIDSEIHLAAPRPR